MKEKNSGSLVLAVDDDPVARRVLVTLLEKDGHEVVSGGSAEEAQEAFESLGAARFGCVVTDYRMPGLNGVDLRAWIWLQDPHISAILVTAEGEQRLVEQSLRAGFADFLNKPLKASELRGAVRKALIASRRQREIDGMTRNLEQAGLTQKQFLTSELRSGLLRAEVYTKPICQAGGDFFAHIKISATEEVVLLGDVSGHDLGAAYISAYFQGMVRGMLESGRDLTSVLQRFNAFLNEEWGNESTGGPVSLSACALHLDADRGEVGLVNCGNPSATFTSLTGVAEPACATPGYPLGWFPTNSISLTRRVASAGEFTLWTDGLGDLAGTLNTAPLSLVHALMRTRVQGREPVWLERAGDDIMAARVQVGKWLDPFHVILQESYGTECENDIDLLQSCWRNSLNTAVIEVEDEAGPEFLYNVLLCSREAVLNALQHGCAPGQTALYQLSCSTDRKIVRVLVSDPGPGHTFGPVSDGLSAETLTEGHRGLSLIRTFSDRLEVEREGAHLTMDFGWQR